MHIIPHALFLLIVRFVTAMNISDQRSRLRDRSRAAFNAKIDLSITAKISGNGFKQGSRTHSVRGGSSRGGGD